MLEIAVDIPAHFISVGHAAWTVNVGYLRVSHRWERGGATL